MNTLRRASYIVYVAAMLWFAYEVVTAARNAAQPDPRWPVVAARTLPQKCAPFYNDGTDRWIDCIGVGYVSD